MLIPYPYYRQEVQRLQAAEKDATALRTREAKLQTALAEKHLENLELRWRLAAAREATNPSLAQVRAPLVEARSLHTRCCPTFCMGILLVRPIPNQGADAGAGAAAADRPSSGTGI